MKGRFIDPMLLMRTDSLANDGDRWEYQLKFDAYRAKAFKTGGKLHLRSRNDMPETRRVDREEVLGAHPRSVLEV